MATEYISREAAIKQFCDDCMDREWCKSNGESCSRINNINAVPAADVVEVVRCKDCRFFFAGYNEKCCINHKGVVATDENGFCHHAERMAEE